eukprot:CAMPEP_0181422088 /NCGR_PEP_ID=MMETSP1110-20121109/13433_1 /TAXON_ID=174948 /ORGANISM="Symbiodinium sp., Strain CCMP421" /LENGTH=370 /DNA_ID=CAMNT_0023545173 /DNA_START=41 /DNA_END=1153 /DNA_ORIENTATION=-
MAEIQGLNDFQLFRACGPLYPAFAIESLTSILLGVFFCYLALRITVRTDVNAPVMSMLRWMRDSLREPLGYWWQEMKTWPEMNKRPLADRIKICRLLNLAMCIAQAAAAFFTVLRWLHIQNVNGLRYLGYAFTCALMQAELVVLIAPYVPCYKFNVVAVVIFTHVWLVLGWVGSLQAGFLFEDASWESFVENYDFNLLIVTNKGLLIAATAVGLCGLMFVQMPFLSLIYFIKGGYKAHPDLPYYYMRLMMTVWFTWPAFPAWWLVSAEGLGLLADAKSNSVGFAILNCISKGSFTYYMLKTGADHKQRWAKPAGAEAKPQTANWVVRNLQSYDSQGPPALQAEESMSEGKKGIESAAAGQTEADQQQEWV